MYQNIPHSVFIAFTLDIFSLGTAAAISQYRIVHFHCVVSLSLLALRASERAGLKLERHKGDDDDDKRQSLGVIKRFRDDTQRGWNGEGM